MLHFLRCLAVSAALIALAAPPGRAGLNDLKTLMLKGRTTDQEGFPVERVKVVVTGRSLRLSTMSDDLGRYAIAIPLGTAEGLRREPLFVTVRAEHKEWRMALPGGDSQVGLEVKIAASPDGVVRCVARSNDARIAAAAARTLSVDGEGAGEVQVNFLGVQGQPLGNSPSPILSQTAKAAVTGSPRPELAEALPPPRHSPSPSAAGRAARPTSPPIRSTPSAAAPPGPHAKANEALRVGVSGERAETDTEEPEPPATLKLPTKAPTREPDKPARSTVAASQPRPSSKNRAPARSTTTGRKRSAAPSAKAEPPAPRLKLPPEAISPLVSGVPRSAIGSGSTSAASTRSRSTAASGTPTSARPYSSDARERARRELQARQEALARIKQESARAAQRAGSSSNAGTRAPSSAAKPAAPRAASGSGRPAQRMSSSSGSSSSAGRASAPPPADAARGPLAAAAPEQASDPAPRPPSKVIPAPENRARARAGGVVISGHPGVPNAAAGEGDCGCRVRGTVEVRSQRPLERRVRVNVGLGQARQASDVVELFMGSPRAFELPRVPCGTYTLEVGVPAGRPALHVVSGDGSFRCAGVHQVRIVLEPR